MNLRPLGPQPSAYAIPPLVHVHSLYQNSACPNPPGGGHCGNLKVNYTALLFGTDTSENTLRL